MNVLPALIGRTLLSRRQLLRPGLLRLPLLRAQVNTLATEIGADGVWRERGADVARFVGAGRGLLVEPQRANGNRNPRCEGFVPGNVSAGGALPTHFSIVTANGLTTTVIDAAQERGVDLCNLRFHGVASGTQYILQTEAATQIAALPSAIIGVGWNALVVDATLPPLAHSTRVSSKNSIGNNIASDTASFVPGASVQRFSRAATLSSNVGTSFVTLDYRFTTTPGASYDFIMGLGWFQTEPLFPTSPILPPAGTPGVSARGADLIRPTLASLGIPPGGDCTLVFDLMIPQAAPAGVNQTILMLDDGTTDERFVLHNPAGGATVVPFRTTGGNVASGGSAGTFTPGAQFRVAASIKAGRIAASLAGGAVVAATGGPTSGLTTARFFNNLAANGSLAGEVAAIDLLPPVPDGVLRALSAGAM